MIFIKREKMGNKTQQKLKKIHFHNLKNLKDLEISFDEKP